MIEVIEFPFLQEITASASLVQHQVVFIDILLSHKLIVVQTKKLTGRHETVKFKLASFSGKIHIRLGKLIDNGSSKVQGITILISHTAWSIS